MLSSRSKLHDAPFSGPPWWIAALWLAGALIAQVTVLHHLMIRDVEPSLVLIVVVWYAIRVDSPRAAVYGLAAGLMEDILSAQTGGAWTISTTLVAITAGMLSRGFFADSIPLVTALTGAVTLVRMLLFWIAMSVEGYPPGAGAIHFHEAIFQAILNMIVMVIAMLIVRRFDTRLV